MSVSIEEQKKLHFIDLPHNYLPSVELHEHIPRDRYHMEYSQENLNRAKAKSVLDIGCFDGWLDFWLIGKGYNVEGVEIMPNLVKAAKRYADRNFIDYKIHEGEFLSVSINKKFDAVVCYETLEHVDLETAKEYISKIESLAERVVLISLPNQKAEDNPQHKWTPTHELISMLFAGKNNLIISTHKYPGTQVPDNFFISYSV